MQVNKVIRSIDQLKKLSENGCDCFILLDTGLRSSKHIWWDKQANHFEVINEIDDSEQALSEQEIMDRNKTNIGYAMLNGALYRY